MKPSSTFRRTAGSPTGLDPAGDGVWPHLPLWLRLEKPIARDWILRRVGVVKGWGWSGAPSQRARRGAWSGSGQRVIVRTFISIQPVEIPRSYWRLDNHLRYLQREGVGLGGARAEFFDRKDDGLEIRGLAHSWRDDRRHYRIMISPEHGDCLADLRGYVREVMSHVSADLSEPELTWLGTCHFNTDHPHAHVVVRGRRQDGAVLLISPKYLYHGISARAREVASAQLGDFSRGNEERGVWRETKAERFTALDRRLVQSATQEGLVGPEPGQGPTWRALIRARLRTLAALGLAVPAGAQYRIAPDLQQRLTAMDLTKAKLRTINEHRLATGARVEELMHGRVKGEVLKSGFHDRHRTFGYAIVRDGRGGDHYARLAIGEAPPMVGGAVELTMSSKGAQRSAELDLGL